MVFRDIIKNLGIAAVLDYRTKCKLVVNGLHNTRNTRTRVDACKHVHMKFIARIYKLNRNI